MSRHNCRLRPVTEIAQKTVKILPVTNHKGEHNAKR
jgi:hypothetical protein